MKNIRHRSISFTLILSLLLAFGCKKDSPTYDVNIVMLHHSTGNIIWNGKSPSVFYKVINRISAKWISSINRRGKIPSLMNEYNKEHDTKYHIEEMVFPKETPYGWNNFPYDYYNIWIKNAGEEAYMTEPTLEMLTKEYNVIIFKHCFPVSNINPDEPEADINSNVKTLSNYKLQYDALKEKLHEFPQTRFIVFTGAAQVDGNISEEKAERAREFFTWVKNEWDNEGDNIFVWDLYEVQTEGGLYFLPEYASSEKDSHPNTKFAKKASALLFQRIIDVIENNGTKTSLSGESL